MNQKILIDSKLIFVVASLKFGMVIYSNDALDY